MKPGTVYPIYLCEQADRRELVTASDGGFWRGLSKLIDERGWQLLSNLLVIASRDSGVAISIGLASGKRLLRIRSQ